LTRESTQRNEDKEMLTFVKFGRSHKLLDTLIEEVKSSVVKKSDGLSVRMWQDDYWSCCTEHPSRKEDSIYLSKGVKENLWNRLETFLGQEEFYLEHGIPYHFGILLHGPPGTGKTSIVKTLASRLKWDLCILKSADLGKLGSAASSLGKNQVLLVEDFDSYCPTTSNTKSSTPPQTEEVDVTRDGSSPPLTHRTSPKTAHVETPEDTITEMNLFYKDLGLSELLNSLDGVTSAHGRIAIFTTNHLDKIDPAVLRPGRIDLKIEIGYVDDHSMDKFLLAFFDKGLGGRHVRTKELTIAELQNEVLSGKEHEHFLKKYC